LTHSDYDPTVHPLLARWASERGIGCRTIARRIGVEPGQFAQWMLDHPELADAVREGQWLADAKVVQALYERSVGGWCETTEIVVDGDGNDKKRRVKRTRRQFPPDPASFMFFLKNRIPDQWRSRPTRPTPRIIAHIRPINVPPPHHETDDPPEPESAPAQSGGADGVPE
jgi:hypothetical protein